MFIASVITSRCTVNLPLAAELSNHLLTILKFTYDKPNLSNSLRKAI